MATVNRKRLSAEGCPNADVDVGKPSYASPITWVELRYGDGVRERNPFGDVIEKEHSEAEIDL